MNHLRRVLLLAAMFVIPLPLLALSEQTGDESVEQNRRTLALLRKNPEQYARLRRDAREFLALPPERQAQLIKLDRDLHEQRLGLQNRLTDALRRYNDWLESLPEEERKRVKEAPDRETRLQLIRELREQEWLKSLPLAQRSAVQRLQGPARAELVRKIHQEERQRQREWQVALKHWEELHKGRPLPTRLSEFPQEVQTYVTEYLKPLLTEEEWTRLEKTEGQWPQYPCTLVELADRHPVALLGPRGPTHFHELPAEIQKVLLRNKTTPKGLLQKSGGRWPGFAIAVTQLAKNHHLTLPHEFWPRRHADLSAGMQSFVDRKLKPLLDAQESEQLKQAEGSWPAYPQQIELLSAKHLLAVPWQTLPGSRERWDSFRFNPPAVARQPGE